MTKAEVGVVCLCNFACSVLYGTSSAVNKTLSKDYVKAFWLAARLSQNFALIVTVDS